MKNENKKDRLWKVQFKFVKNFICVEAVKGGCYVDIEGRPSIKVKFPGFFMPEHDRIICYNTLSIPEP